MLGSTLSPPPQAQEAVLREGHLVQEQGFQPFLPGAVIEHLLCTWHQVKLWVYLHFLQIRFLKGRGSLKTRHVKGDFLTHDLKQEVRRHG